jgi:hypothetical protein
VFLVESDQWKITPLTKQLLLKVPACFDPILCRLITLAKDSPYLLGVTPIAALGLLR